MNAIYLEGKKDFWSCWPRSPAESCQEDEDGLPRPRPGHWLWQGEAGGARGGQERRGPDQSGGAGAEAGRETATE